MEEANGQCGVHIVNVERERERDCLERKTVDEDNCQTQQHVARDDVRVLCLRLQISLTRASPNIGSHRILGHDAPLYDWSTSPGASRALERIGFKIGQFSLKIENRIKRVSSQFLESAHLILD